MTVREELKAQLAAEEEAARSGRSRKALNSSARLPVSANATSAGLATAATPSGGALQALQCRSPPSAIACLLSVCLPCAITQSSGRSLSASLCVTVKEERMLHSNACCTGAGNGILVADMTDESETVHGGPR